MQSVCDDFYTLHLFFLSQMWFLTNVTSQVFLIDSNDIKKRVEILHWLNIAVLFSSFIKEQLQCTIYCIFSDIFTILEISYSRSVRWLFSCLSPIRQNSDFNLQKKKRAKVKTDIHFATFTQLFTCCFTQKKDAGCLDPHTHAINTNSGAVTPFPASPHDSKWRQPAGKSPV